MSNHQDDYTTLGPSSTGLLLGVGNEQKSSTNFQR